MSSSPSAFSLSPGFQNERVHLLQRGLAQRLALFGFETEEQEVVEKIVDDVLHRPYGGPHHLEPLILQLDGALLLAPDAGQVENQPDEEKHSRDQELVDLEVLQIREDRQKVVEDILVQEEAIRDNAEPEEPTGTGMLESSD